MRLKALLLSLLLIVAPAIASAGDIIVKYTEDEIRVQMTLNDVAVKSAGLQAAEAAIFLTKKLQQAVASSKIQQPVSPPEPDKTAQ